MENQIDQTLIPKDKALDSHHPLSLRHRKQLISHSETSLLELDVATIIHVHVADYLPISILNSPILKILK